MLRACLVGLFVLAVMLSPTFSAEPIVAAPAVSAARVDAAAARSDELFGRGGLTIRQRRELGLTIPNIAKTLRTLHAEGAIEQGMSRSEIAALVLDRMSAENPAFAGEGVDLDGILAFLEAIIPLLMTILALFSVVIPGVLVGRLRAIYASRLHD